MIVKDNNKEYYVTWRYETDINEEDPFSRIQCSCYICNTGSKVLPDNPSGVAYKHPKDNFVKDIARRLSLERAMTFNKFDKQTKAKFWEAYRLMTKNPRW